MGDTVFIEAFWTYVAVKEDSQKSEIVKKEIYYKISEKLNIHF